MAARLNALGYKNWKGQAFTIKKLSVLRHAYKLKSRLQRLRARGLLTGELGRQLGVGTTTIHRWGREGVLRRHLYGNDHRCLYEPPADVVLVKGAGGHYSGKLPVFISAPSTKQSAV